MLIVWGFFMAKTNNLKEFSKSHKDKKLASFFGGV